jgi:hypothetical protein
MPLSRPLKVVIAVLTAWPFLYMFLFFAFIAGTMIWISAMPQGGGSDSSGPAVAFLVLMAAHLATILLTLGLSAFYIVFLFKTDRVPQDKKALWAVVLFLANMLAMPVFFYLYVWPDEWPKKGQRTDAASA